MEDASNKTKEERVKKARKFKNNKIDRGKKSSTRKIDKKAKIRKIRRKGNRKGKGKINMEGLGKGKYEVTNLGREIKNVDIKYKIGKSENEKAKGGNYLSLFQKKRKDLYGLKQMYRSAHDNQMNYIDSRISNFNSNQTDCEEHHQ